MDEAHRTQLKEPNAFTLSTVNASGQPHSRVLLCKEVRDKGLVFYTNYKSAKADDLEKNNLAAANFFWDPLHRQIRVNGEIVKLSREDSDAYWATRDRSSQLSQWVSKQSEEAQSREQMENELAQTEEKFSGQDIPCPDHWGGYLLKPSSIEFWVGRSGRFHDRHLFTMVENDWASERLYP